MENNAYLATSSGVVYKISFAEHRPGLLGAIPLPHPVHFPQVTTTSWSILAPGRATLWIEEFLASTP
jgi:hypothetical protein